MGAFGKHENCDFFQLHPDHEARHHGGQRRIATHGMEAQPLDINAGEHRACHRRQGDDQHIDLVMRMQPRSRIRTEHDGGAEGEVESAHDTEHDREADRQQRVG